MVRGMHDDKGVGMMRGKKRGWILEMYGEVKAVVETVGVNGYE